MEADVALAVLRSDSLVTKVIEYDAPGQVHRAYYIVMGKQLDLAHFEQAASGSILLVSSRLRAAQPCSFRADCERLDLARFEQTASGSTLLISSRLRAARSCSFRAGCEQLDLAHWQTHRKHSAAAFMASWDYNIGLVHSSALPLK